MGETKEDGTTYKDKDKEKDNYNDQASRRTKRKRQGTIQTQLTKIHKIIIKMYMYIHI